MKLEENQPKKADWHEVFSDFVTSITTATHGKQQYFEQNDGLWYSRISGKYLSTDEMISEYLREIREQYD